MERTRQLSKLITHYWRFSVAIAALLIGLILYIFGLKTAAEILLSGVAVLSTIPIIKNMWADLRSGTYGLDVLALTAIFASALMHEYWAAIVIVIMLTGGETLEQYANQRAKTELDALLDKAPQKATVERNRKTLTIKASEVRVGDKVQLKPGEVVPVDGVVRSGVSNFDEASITGESTPQRKQVGEAVLSGSVNLDGAVVLTCTHTAANSQYEQIVKLVRVAQNSQAPFVRLADRYSIPFTLVSYAIAIAAWIMSGDSRRFLEVIVVATPCPLLLAAPIAIISGMSRAARHGIIVKTGGALERLAEAKAVAFDKTGTLTEGALRVEKVISFTPYKSVDVLRFAASLEQQSGHVLAKAIVAKAASGNVKAIKARQLRETSGQGLQAQVNGTPVLVGRLDFLKSKGVTLPSSFDQTTVQQTATYVAADGVLAGYLTFADTVRAESRDTVTRLRELGIGNILMVTGDHKASASAVAKHVGIYARNITAQALPADKLYAIEKVAERPLAFVGDGVNDAPVLTAAEVGIALGARSSTAASESADMVIMLDDISRVAKAVEIAKHTFSIARQSILVGIGLSVLLMFIFATGKFNPLTGAILQEVVDVVVILGALRAHGTWHRIEISTETEPVPA